MSEMLGTAAPKKRNYWDPVPVKRQDLPSSIIRAVRQLESIGLEVRHERARGYDWVDGRRRPAQLRHVVLQRGNILLPAAYEGELLAFVTGIFEVTAQR